MADIEAQPQATDEHPTATNSDEEEADKDFESEIALIKESEVRLYTHTL